MALGGGRHSLRLALRVLGARLDRDRDGLFVFFVGVVLFRVAAAVYSLTALGVAAAPVVVLAGRATISHLAPHASRRVVGQWGGAGGAICEDHFCVGLAFVQLARAGLRAHVEVGQRRQDVVVELQGRARR